MLRNVLTLTLILGLALSSCIPLAKSVMTQEQAIRASTGLPKDLANRIAEVDTDLRQARTVLNQAAMGGYFNETTYETVAGPLRASDYYMAKAWAAMVEGDIALSVRLVEEAELAYSNALAAFTAATATGTSL